MTQATVPSSTLVGVDAIDVEVQVDVSAGLPAFTIVGLGDTAVLEARDRVRAALRSSGFDFPNARVTVNLAPSPVRKHGTGFDLPIAVGVLAATGQVPRDVLAAVSVGELGLDGSVRSVPGMLAHAIAAPLRGLPLLASVDALMAAQTVKECVVHPLGSLGVLRQGLPPASARMAAAPPADIPVPDFLEVTDSPWPRGPLRSRRPVGSDCCWWDRRDRRRRCWHGACRRYSLRWTTPRS